MNQERLDLLRFTKKVGLGCALASLFFGVSFYLLKTSGELLSTDEAIDRQFNSPDRAIYGNYFSTVDLSYKWKVALRKSPKIMAMGTSRIMPLRANFFKEGSSFYNVGASDSSLGLDAYFIESIPREQQPRIIILVLDQLRFNPNREKEYTPLDVNLTFQKQTSPKEILKLGCIGVYKEILENGFPYRLFNKERKGDIGLYAITEQAGFRKDGSAAVNTQKIKSTRLNDAFRNIDRGEKAFTYGPFIATSQIADVENFLSLCKKRGIYVIAFLPPYPHSVYEKMKATVDRYAYVFKLNPILRDIFRRYSYGYYDFTDLAEVGATDEETYDGYHASEKGYLRLFIRMAKSDPVLGPYTDIPALEKRLNETVSHFYVFGDDE